MHSLFAIEPKAIDNWQDLRYVVEKFGFSDGLLIARYPKRWMAMVMDACRANEQVGDVELKRIEEKLRLVKEDRSLKMGLPFEGEYSWCENVVKAEVLSRMTAVIVKEAVEREKLYALEDIDEKVFKNRREVRVKRNADNLADAARFLIGDSHSLTLVDPYFRPKRSCLKVLMRLLLLTVDSAKPEIEVVIHVAYSSHPVDAQRFKTECINAMPGLHKFEIKVSVVRWNDENIDFDLHARYLLADQGGLRYDRGFLEPEDLGDREKVTDIVCLDENFRLEIIEQFCNYHNKCGVVDIIHLLQTDSNG